MQTIVYVSLDAIKDFTNSKYFSSGCGCSEFSQLPAICRSICLLFLNSSNPSSANHLHYRSALPYFLTSICPINAEFSLNILLKMPRKLKCFLILNIIVFLVFVFLKTLIVAHMYNSLYS